MKKAIKEYKKITRKMAVASRLENECREKAKACSQEDKTVREGILDVKDEYEMLKRAGGKYTEWVESYKAQKLNGINETTDLRNGENLDIAQSIMDIEREIKEKQKYRKELIDRRKKLQGEISEKINNDNDNNNNDNKLSNNN